MKSQIGDLTLGTARPGAEIRCVAVHDLSPWAEQHKKETFVAPAPGKIYHVRAVSLAGVLVAEIRNSDIGLTVLVGQDIAGEPFFPFECFNFVR